MILDPIDKNGNKMRFMAEPSQDNFIYFLKYSLKAQKYLTLAFEYDNKILRGQLDLEKAQNADLKAENERLKEIFEARNRVDEARKLYDDECESECENE
ncbi:hypothetical protein OFN70_07560 [Campylobacter sp. CN_NE3]|uniref:hypothetical protein n=1 Tax=Campylobacter sp. CN_NE3 TaxID=2984149 RepID=UPI0022E9F466|nr:hypothetical protein [Campylobacter sp. CN_NE3]MDA3069381.1 hypothetical protein [Campylobacter sp. CN_NE3]